MINLLKNKIIAIKKDYMDTKGRPNEDFLEWFIQRKMTWGARWILVIILDISLPLLFLKLSNLFYFFAIMLFFMIVYVLVWLYDIIKSKLL